LFLIECEQPLRSTRENLAHRNAERWQPLVFRRESGVRGRLLAALRRLFDLQAGSIWRDLRPALGSVHGTLVDAGCGASPYRQLVPGDTTYVGLDLAQASEEFGYDVDDVRRFGADGSWPVDDGGADVVLSTETLEHVPEPGAFLAEAFRVLRPGGQLVLTVPFAARWHYVPYDYWRFTPSALTMLLEGAGFDDVFITARGNERTVACYKLLALLLPAAMPQRQPGKLSFAPLAVLVAAPLVSLLAIVGNLSLRGGAGDDCLGYTVTAQRPRVPRVMASDRPDAL
jgi:SAM-dependent methyltransferase